MSGILILLPNVLHEEEGEFRQFLPSIVEEKVISLHGLIAESEKEARRYLKRFSFPAGRSFRDLPLKTLNEHTKEEDLLELIAPLLETKERWGLISDAGLPCLADPGASLVALARQKGVQIEAISGPSSLVLALMLSGLSAQQFSFHGYLPRDSDSLRKKIKTLEKASQEERMTQVFIEAPYRCQTVFQALLEELQLETRLSICINLTSSTEEVLTSTVREWKKKKSIDLQRKLVIFLFLSK